jgi:hypothetical protein
MAHGHGNGAERNVLIGKFYKCDLDHAIWTFALNSPEQC